MSQQDGQLGVTGGITKALLSALDQLHDAVAAQLVNPDGSPSGTAVYMHLPIGRPIDPRMYAFPWTPGGSASSSAVSDTGQFAAPAPVPAATGAATTPAAALAAKPATPDPKLEQAIKAAFNTSHLVDDMLMITNKGVASSWPQHTVSIEYFTVLAGMQAQPVPPPQPDVQKQIDDAQKLLYTFDSGGNMAGYTPKYSNYRHNTKLWEDATSAFASAYASAMADPVQGQSWPVSSAKYQTDIDQAYNDLYAMGGKEVEDALATLHSIGGSAAAALIAQARKLYDAYAIGLGGAIGVKVPWSYIDPESWWDPTNSDFGIMQINADSSTYNAGESGGTSSFAHSFYSDQSSSTSGSAGFDIGLYSASANASESDSSSDSGANQSNAQWSHFADESSSASISFEYFLASIERPWLLGDLFHMEGWYLVGMKKGAISDGTIAGQLTNADDSKLLPMIPKGFLIVRNVTITADNWGQAGDSFSSAMSQSTGHTDASSSSFGGSAGYLGFGGSVQHSQSDDHGVFDAQSGSNYGWSYESSAQGGTLRLLGAQIVGWIGEIQPASPKVDAPTTGG
jgi:hypothetical protein